MKNAPQPRWRRMLVVLFCSFVALAVSAWLVVAGSPQPCNVDDFTGCNRLGEVALFGLYFFLGPITIVLAALIALVWIGDLVRRR